MSLREACLRLRQRPEPVLRLPEKSMTQQAAEKLVCGGTGAEFSPPKDLNQIAARLRADLLASRALSRRDLRDAAWCLWTTQPALAAEPEVLQRYLNAIKLPAHRRSYRTLASVYLQQFNPNQLAFAQAANFLAVYAPGAGAPWAAAQETLAIFEPSRGPSEVAEAALKQGVKLSDILRELGLGAAVAASGFGKAAHAAGLKLMAGATNRDPLGRLKKVEYWAYEDGKLVFSDLKAEVMDALLAPFAEDMPEKAIRDNYLGFILKQFGDPRVRGEKWIGLVTCEHTIRRWLTEQSLRQFFDVVDGVAKPEHWRYRRKFWEALYEGGYIQEAWAVFEKHGAAEASRLFGKDITFGQFRSSGAQIGHAVLLLRLGSLTVAEWSHNGPCSIWDHDEEQFAPPLYSRAYRASILKKQAIAGITREEQGIFWHAGSDNYRWQQKISQFLRKRLNIQLRHGDYCF